jgi:RNA methyltransferase, TrmH family
MAAPKLIQSRDNALFKDLLKLSKSSHERRKKSVTLLDGPHLIEAFAAAGHEIDTLVLSETGARHNEAQRLFARVRAKQHVQLKDALFQDIAATVTPVGLMALVDTPVPAHEPDDYADTVMLEAIQDPGNLGSILRTAAAAGVRQVLLSRGSVFAWSPKVLRAGMGAHFALEIFEDRDLADFIRRFRGLTVATAGEARESLYSLSLRQPVAWLFGNEGAGLSSELAMLAAARVRIPMPGKAESLNIAAAVAVCLFEKLRQS